MQWLVIAKNVSSTKGILLLEWRILSGDEYYWQDKLIHLSSTIHSDELGWQHRNKWNEFWLSLQVPSRDDVIFKVLSFLYMFLLFFYFFYFGFLPCYFHSILLHHSEFFAKFLKFLCHLSNSIQTKSMNQPNIAHYKWIFNQWFSKLLEISMKERKKKEQRIKVANKLN